MLVAHRSYLIYLTADSASPGEFHDSELADVDILNLFTQLLYNCLVPVMGIASTLIVVRSAMGIAINDAKTFEATMLRNHATVTTSGLMSSIVDVSQRSRDVARRTEDEEEGHVVREDSTKVEASKHRV
ncbi:hypothetical protein V5O48_007068 [Marasmius crinis-equi]|uniref:Uncharacterized protein n=1 Tax=Marasmius crinis-equi TaxID=585013 RepID=A0ABR3FHQ8_9AGAR